MNNFHTHTRTAKQLVRTLIARFNNKTYAIALPLLLLLTLAPLNVRTAVDLYLLDTEVPADLVDLTHRRPSTYPYVLHYSQYKDTEFDTDISDEITQGEIPLFYQWDARWGYHIYGSNVLALTGCGPTCLSMVYSGITGKDDYDPKTLADWAFQNGYYVNGSGTAWSFMVQGAAHLGLKVQNVAPSAAKITEALAAGKVIIATMKPGHFTDKGHFIVLTGLTETGRILVNDPNSWLNSRTSWDVSVVLSEMKSMWVYETQN